MSTVGSAAEQPAHEQATTLIPLVASPGADGFDVVLRGYDREQVDRHLAYTETLLSSAEERASEAEAEAGRLRRELLDAERAAASGRAASYRELGERIGEMLATAETEAAELRARAEQTLKQAERVLAEAEHTAHERATGIREEARKAAAQTLDDARRQADQMIADARAGVAGLEREREEIRASLGALHERLAAATGPATP